jgi:hypothetical protein
MDWITHVFVKSNHDAEMIDGSQWPISIQEINEELTIVQNVLKKGQPPIDNGHQLHPRIKHLLETPEEADGGGAGAAGSEKLKKGNGSVTSNSMAGANNIFGGLSHMAAQVGVGEGNQMPIFQPHTFRPNTNNLQYIPGVSDNSSPQQLNIEIVSLCAYPPEHVLPGYAISNHNIYAKKHGYRYYVERNRVDPDRPHAWGKIRLLQKRLAVRGEDSYYVN